jgi:hypothetical protein
MEVLCPFASGPSSQCANNTFMFIFSVILVADVEILAPETHVEVAHRSKGVFHPGWILLDIFLADSLRHRLLNDLVAFCAHKGVLEDRKLVAQPRVPPSDIATALNQWNYEFLGSCPDAVGTVPSTIDLAVVLFEARTIVTAITGPHNSGMFLYWSVEL